MGRLNLHRLDRELDALASCGLDSHAFRHEAMARVRHVIPMDAYCFASADPSTLVMTAIATDGVDRGRAPLLYRNEHGERDVAKHADLARGRTPVRVLAQETGGSPERSPRYRDVLAPMGVEHELRAAAIEAGTTWGFVHLFRGAGRRGFDSDEVAAMTVVSRQLAAGIRAAELAHGAATVPAAEAPNLVLLDAADRPALVSGGPAWLERLRDPDVPDQAVPEVLVTLATAARALARRGATEAACARVRGSDGAWWLLHATCADGPEATEGQVAVIVQPAAGLDLLSILLRGLGLNAGERQVTELVLQGRPTKQIAEDLVISPWTVQDRLKRVFTKAGVRSRRELVARLNPAA
jgi:DNA-binding CsgD family transcriptional regulator